MKTSALALLLALFAAACRTTAPADPPPAPAATGDILAVEEGAGLSFEALIGRLREARVVYVGEQHDDPGHHEFQRRVVEALHRADPNLVIGMEMFQRPFQGALDRFLAGEIDEERMLAETEYLKRWSFDYRFYRPVLLYAREHGLPVIALNAPAETTRKISREGLAALTPEERAGIAEEIDLHVAPHREFIEGIFAGHPMPPGMDFENFYAAQCTWEDTMAESAAEALAARPGARMVVLAGGGHVRGGYGIPIRAARRGASPYAILLPREPGPITRGEIAEAQEKRLADYLYAGRPREGYALTPRLGVMLGAPDDRPGLPVTTVGRGGLGALAGLRQGDRLLAVNGRPVGSADDLRTALIFMEERMGELRVERDGEEIVLPFDRAWAS